LTTSPPKTLTATFAIPVPQSGTLAPRMDRSNTATLSVIGSAGPYVIYSVLVQQTTTAQQLFGTSVDIKGEGVDTEVMFFKMFRLFG